MKELELKKLLENGEFTLLKNKLIELSHSRQFNDQALLQKFQFELSSNIQYQQFIQNKDFSITQSIENKSRTREELNEERIRLLNSEQYRKRVNDSLKPSSLKEDKDYKHNYTFYNKALEKYGMSWNELSAQEKQSFESGMSRFSTMMKKEIFSELNTTQKQTAERIYGEIQALALANQHNKVSEKNFEQKTEALSRELYQVLIQGKNLTNLTDLEACSKIRQEYDTLIDQNPTFSDEQRKKMKKEWAYETDAVHHLLQMAKSVKNQENINEKHIEYMVGVLHRPSISESSKEVVKTLFTDNSYILDHIMQNKSLRDVFINKLTDGENKREHLTNLMKEIPEIKEKLEGYGINIGEYINKREMVDIDFEKKDNYEIPPDIAKKLSENLETLHIDKNIEQEQTIIKSYKKEYGSL